MIWLAVLLSAAVALALAFVALLQRFLNSDAEKQGLEYQAKFDALKAMGDGVRGKDRT